LQLLIIRFVLKFKKKQSFLFFLFFLKNLRRRQQRAERAVVFLQSSLAHGVDYLLCSSSKTGYQDTGQKVGHPIIVS